MINYAEQIEEANTMNGLDESYLQTALENSFHQEQFIEEELDEDFDFDDDLQMDF